MIFKDEEPVEEVSEPVTPEEVTPDTQTDEPYGEQDPQEMLRALKADRDAQAQQAQFYQNIAMQNYKPQQPAAQQMTPQQQAKFQHDDILTYGEINSELENRLSSVQQSMTKMRGQFSEELVRREYKDYEDVIEKYVLPMVQKDPAIMNLIDASDNPALTAYRLGQATPEYAAQQRKADTLKVTDKIEKNLAKPKTLGSASSSPKGTPTTYADMSSEEFAAARYKALGF